MSYLATVNVPGDLPMGADSLPMDDEPPVFDTARGAWEYLYDVRLDEWSDYDYSDYESDAALLEMETADAEGEVYASTPGYKGSHDLGLVYRVTWIADDDDECLRERGE